VIVSLRADDPDPLIGVELPVQSSLPPDRPLRMHEACRRIFRTRPGTRITVFALLHVQS